MLSGSKLVTAFSIGAGIAAGAMLVAAFLKARPTTTGNVSAIPPTPATSSSVAAPLYDVLNGVAGVTPIQAHPDVDGVSIAPTNPS